MEHGRRGDRGRHPIVERDADGVARPHPEGEIVIGGIALVPITQLSVEWRGIGDTMAASEAAANIDRLAESLYREIFEFDSNR